MAPAAIRWLNHLDPSISKEPWTENEERVIYEAQVGMGCLIMRWFDGGDMMMVI